MSTSNSIQNEIDSFWPSGWIYNDAGRSKTKWSGTNDCGIRAISVATGMSYDKSRKYLKAFTHIGIAKNRRISNGVFVEDMDLAMESLGWFYTKLPNNILCFDLPNLTALCNMRKHFVTIQDGILQDTWDSTGLAIRGYWTEL